MSSTVTLSKNMPQKFNVADSGNSFILGRKAFFNNTYQSHKIENLGNNNSSTNSVKTNRLGAESGNNPKLQTKLLVYERKVPFISIGSGSVKLKDSSYKVSYKQEFHKNVINNAKTKVRGGGAGSVPKSNSIPITSM